MLRLVRAVVSISSWRRQTKTVCRNVSHFSQFDVSPESITSHLDKSEISSFWLSQLEKVERAVARDMIAKLVPDNAVGYSNPTSSMLQFVLKEKRNHPDKVIVLRCGDFYEVYGIDAVMFVAYCGLNPMRGPKIVRAGCPIASIQHTLDGITNAGLSAAIYEEIEDPDTGRGPPSKRPKAKKRVFSYVVSPGCSVYPYKLSLKNEDIDYPTNKPYVGIHGTVSQGFNVVEVRIDEQNITQYSRLSEEAVMSLLSTNGYVEPLYVQNIDTLKIIMYSIYSDHSQNKPDDIKGQIQDLNKLILEYAVNNVYNEAIAYKHYLRDQSTLAMPFDRSLQNDRDYKHLEHKNFM